ncbi:hypothetical protein NG799_21765 [Laspinema sp. D1]|uniref:Uncharacterized protein n=1 Tax=Laspinema palackyanum D2a TaxID=2953684 RepID=A0ABT2MWQ7_9CYAN|nr:hypothetical protein [Laspinema sp. D2a]
MKPTQSDGFLLLAGDRNSISKLSVLIVIAENSSQENQIHSSVFPAGDSWWEWSWVFPWAIGSDRSPGLEPTQSNGFNFVSASGEGMSQYF